MTPLDWPKEAIDQLRQPWVVDFAHSDTDMSAMSHRLGLEPVQHIDCLATPSGSEILGYLKCHRESEDVYRVIYLVRYPTGQLRFGVGQVLFGDEPQKLEQRYGAHIEVTP